MLDMEGYATDVTMLRKRLDLTDRKLLKAKLVSRLPGDKPTPPTRCL